MCIHDDWIQKYEISSPDKFFFKHGYLDTNMMAVKYILFDVPLGQEVRIFFLRVACGLVGDTCYDCLWENHCS